MLWAHVTGIWGGDIKREHETGTWSGDMKRGHEAGIWSRDMKRGHEAGTWSRTWSGDMSRDMQRGDVSATICARSCEFVRHEAARTKWPQFSMSHCVHCSCKLFFATTLKQHAYTRRGLSPFHVPSTCPIAGVQRPFTCSGYIYLPVLRIKKLSDTY